MTLPHIIRQKVQNHNPQLILIQKYFLVSILLKQRKNQHPKRTSTKIWQLKILLKLRVFWLHKIWALKQNKLKLLAEQVQKSASHQLCKEISFGITIFCTFKKCYFLKLATWKNRQKHSCPLSKIGEKLLFLHHNLASQNNLFVAR